MAAAIAHRLGAERQGHNWRVECPNRCGYDIAIADGEDGRLLAHCFGGCTFDEVLPALIEFDEDADAGEYEPARPVESAIDIARRRAHARQLYDRLAPAAGTIAERYLRSRGITIEIPRILRFGLCPHRSGGTCPAMAAPIVDMSGEQTAVHLTFLASGGSAKAAFIDTRLQRETRGVLRGGAIHLAPHNPGSELIIAEGIETTLSAMQIFGLPGWSVVYAGGLKTIELPSAVRRIVIGADNDRSSAGQRNALAAYDRWRAEGRTVRIKCPSDVGADFNDVLIRRGR
jgi:hypothetical protein